MSKTEIIHETFVVERTYPVPPARVFTAFADPEEKKRWFVIDNELAKSVSYENDFRVGGKETSRFRLIDTSPGGSAAGTLMGNDAIYLDIVTNERIVYAYSMLVADARISTSLTTIDLVPDGKGTRVVVTEQAVFYGQSKAIKLRKAGLEHILGKLAEALA